MEAVRGMVRIFSGIAQYSRNVTDERKSFAISCSFADQFFITKQFPRYYRLTSSPDVFHFFVTSVCWSSLDLLVPAEHGSGSKSPAFPSTKVLSSLLRLSSLSRKRKEKM